MVVRNSSNPQSQRASSTGRRTSFVYKPPEPVVTEVEKSKVPLVLSPLERVHCAAVVRMTMEKLTLINALPVDIVKRVRALPVSAAQSETRTSLATPLERHAAHGRVLICHVALAMK